MDDLFTEEFYERINSFVRSNNELTWLFLMNCDLDTCKVLMRTFANDDDFGVQESVVSVLSTAKSKTIRRRY